MKLRKTQIALALTAVVAVSGGLVGCDGTNLDSPNSSPIISNPTADVTGKVSDATTGAPIVGAVVIIEGLNISATTNAQGNYVLKDVPATTTLDGTGIGSYRVSINMAGVTSPVTTTTDDYADLDSTGNTLTVRASDSGNAGTTGVSIGETGVNNVQNFMVGKATAHVEGNIYDTDTTTRVAGVTVALQQDTTGAGAWETVATAVTTADDAATTTVNELGSFHFHGVEAGFKYQLVATTEGKTVTYAVPSLITGTASNTLAEKEEVDTDLRGKVVLGMVDTTGPSITKRSIDATGYDFATGATVAVSWTFSEPIGDDAKGYRDSFATGGNLYEDVVVTYDGSKAGEVAKTVAWNTDFTVLTVTIPSPKAGSTYTMNIGGINGDIEDNAANASTTIAADALRTTTFTVALGATAAPSAPSPVVITSPVNLGVIDYTGTNVTLDWPGVAGVKGYNVYRTATVGGTSMGATRIADYTTVTTSNATDNFTDTSMFGTGNDLVTANNESITYAYTVTAVDADGKESAASTATTAVADKVAPTAAAVTAVCTDGTAGTNSAGGTGDKIVVTFTEPMNKTDAETAANYTTLPASSSWIEYDISTMKTTVQYPDTTAGRAACTNGGVDDTITPVTMKDVGGNAITTGAVTY